MATELPDTVPSTRTLASESSLTIASMPVPSPPLAVASPSTVTVSLPPFLAPASIAVDSLLAFA